MAKQAVVRAREEFIRKVLTQHAHSLHQADFFYQVTYCETRYSHRTINFEID